MRATLVPVDLVRLTTYSDRVAETVSRTFHFCGQPAVQFDFKNEGTVRDFEPLIDSIGDVAMDVNHLPSVDDGSIVRRSWDVTLVNATLEGSRVAEVLDGENISSARVEWYQLLVEPGDLQAPLTDLSSYTGAEATLLYDGWVERAAPIDEDSVTLRCSTRVDSVEWLRASSDADPAFIGRRLPIVYGAAKRVEAVADNVGAVSTLAVELTDAAPTITLSDATSFPTSGNAMIGAESVSWTGKSGNDLTTVTRGANSTTAALHLVGENSVIRMLRDRGEVVLEVVATATFVVAGHEVSSIGDVYVLSPYSGELVRLTGTAPASFTKTANDTTYRSGEAGITALATVQFTAAQLRAVLDELAAAQQPEFDDSGAGTWMQPYTVTGRTAGGDEPERAIDGNLGSAFQDITNSTPLAFSFIDLGGSPTGSRWRFTFNAYPTSGTLLLRDTADATLFTFTGQTLSLPAVFEFEIANADYADFDLHIGASSGFYPAHIERQLIGGPGVRFIEQSPISVTGGPSDQANGMDGNMDTSVLCDGPSSTSTSPSYTFASVSGTVLGQVLIFDIVDTLPTTGQCKVFRDAGTTDVMQINKHATGDSGLDGGDSEPYHFERYLDETGNQFTLGGEVIPDGFEIASFKRKVIVAGGLTRTQDVSLKAASVGSGLRVFVDVDGYKSPASSSPAYKAGASTLMTKPCDILRHWIEEVGVGGTGTIDSTSYDDCNTNLGSNALAFDARWLGLTWEEVLARIAFESRTTLVHEPAAAGDTWRVLTALSTYAFSAASGTVENWGVRGFVQASVDLALEAGTRFLAFYGFDPSRGTGEEAHALTLQADADTNDLTVPSVANFEAAEDAVGRIDAEPISFLCIQDTATAKDVLGYYAHERIRRHRTFALSDVPWTESYKIQAGDVMNLTPPWSSTQRKVRILSYLKRRDAELAELRAVEVE